MTESANVLFPRKDGKRIAGRRINDREFDRIGSNVYCCKFQGPAFSSLSGSATTFVFGGSMRGLVFVAGCAGGSTRAGSSSITFATERRRSAATLRTDRDAFIT